MTAELRIHDRSAHELTDVASVQNAVNLYASVQHKVRQCNDNNEY